MLWLLLNHYFVIVLPWILCCLGFCVTLDERCICVLTTEILGEISVASARTLGHGEETLLSSGWTLIGSELSSPNFNSSV